MVHVRYEAKVCLADINYQHYLSVTFRLGYIVQTLLYLHSKDFHISSVAIRL